MIRLVRLAFRLSKLWMWLARPVTLGVRVILLQEGKVLLVRHTYMKGWHFPGGSMNRWETPLEAAAREAREEVGVELLEPPALVGIYTYYNGGRSDHVVTYVCRNFRQGHATDRWEIAESAYFALDALPPLIHLNWHAILVKLATKNEQS